jgi:hypothetical protein
MALSSSALLPLAQMMGLSPADAIALPTVMAVASHKANITEDFLMFQALDNVHLRDYLAWACRTAMNEVAA